jgi:hypothetical protein
MLVRLSKDTRLLHISHVDEDVVS